MGGALSIVTMCFLKLFGYFCFLDFFFTWLTLTDRHIYCTYTMTVFSGKTLNQSSTTLTATSLGSYTPAPSLCVDYSEHIDMCNTDSGYGAEDGCMNKS